ncbi:hypothetical protein BaRGS_00017731, partial [Batillaria attramentaria]
MGAFTGFYTFSVLLTSTLTTYVNSQVTTLERHFGFSSFQTGLIMAGNEVGFLVVVLFASYIAAQVHIPRSLGYLTILFGVSGIICALPHFVFGAPSYGSDVSAVNVTQMMSVRAFNTFVGQLCDGIHENTSAPCDVVMAKSRHYYCGDDSHMEVLLSGPAKQPRLPDLEREATPTWCAARRLAEGPSRERSLIDRARANAGVAMVIIFLGMVIQGMAKAPRLPFSTAFVDDNVEKTQTGFYVGMISMGFMAGPGLAYGMGGLFTKIYITLEDTDLHPRHPKWIGAWWLGYVTFGLAALVFALPMFCFPRRISKCPPPSTRKNQRGRFSRTNPGGVIYSCVKGWFSAIFRLATNPLYVCCALAVCAKVFAVAGDQAFGPKYIENQFSMPAWKANLSLWCSGNIGNTYVNCTCIQATTASAGMCDYSCAMFYPFLVVSGLSFSFSTMNFAPMVVVFIRSAEYRDRALAVGLTTFTTALTGQFYCSISECECGVKER